MTAELVFWSDLADVFVAPTTRFTLRYPQGVLGRDEVLEMLPFRARRYAALQESSCHKLDDWSARVGADRSACEPKMGRAKLSPSHRAVCGK